MLTRRRPAFFSSSATSGSETPLVVIARSTPRSASFSTSSGDGTNQRLTAGQTDAVDPVALDHDPGDSLDLLEREDLGARGPLHPFLGHAVLATEVAAVRDEMRRSR